MARTLAERPIDVEWDAVVPLHERLSQLAHDLAIPISCDPDVPSTFGREPYEAVWHASALQVLDRVAGSHGLGLRLSGDGVTIVPNPRGPDPRRVSAYQRDPFGAFEAARYFIAADFGFRSRWKTVSDCEQTVVHFGEAMHVDSFTDLLLGFPGGFSSRFESADVVNLHIPGLTDGPARQVLAS